MQNNHTIRVLIVDDEPLARRRIRNLLRECPDVELVGECSDGDEAISFIQRGSPDIVFLDIQMPGKDGFDVLAELSAEQLPVVIFVTAHDKYAVRAFEVLALDYLLKPFTEGRFQQTLRRATLQVHKEKGGDLSRRLVALLRAVESKSEHLDRVIVKSEESSMFLRVEKIDWIEAAGNYVRIHTGKESFLMRETISYLERELNPKVFLRIHRSTIVNVDRIKEILPWFQAGEYAVVLLDGTRLTLSRSYRTRVLG